MPPRLRQETLDRFRTDMERLLRAIDPLAPEDRATAYLETWTVKDALAHVAAWDRALAAGVDELLAGQRPSFVGEKEAAFNARAVEACPALGFDDVVAELRAAHEALIRRIDTLTDAEWEHSSSYRWWNRTPMTVSSLFNYTYKGETHYAGHARELEYWLAHGSEPLRGSS